MSLKRIPTLEEWTKSHNSEGDEPTKNEEYENDKKKNEEEVEDGKKEEEVKECEDGKKKKDEEEEPIKENNDDNIQVISKRLGDAIGNLQGASKLLAKDAADSSFHIYIDDAIETLQKIKTLL